MENKMIHKMKLWDESFKKIKNKTKTIEMRLCDEKRSKIAVGDSIEFINTKTNEICECLVTNLYKYENFNELYNHHDKIAIGYLDNEIADPNDMLVYYTKENIKKYGVLGIEIIK
jgi:ASC-1-like (ASCH) protein